MASRAGRIILTSVRKGLRALDLFLWMTVRFWRALVIAVAGMALCVGVVVAAASWEVSHLLPDDPTTLMDGREVGSITVLDRDGRRLGVRGQRFQRLTAGPEIKTIIDAVLATEDRRFYWHIGLDPIGVTRALLVNWRAGRTEQGGSSITQQVAKLAFLSSERRLQRKLRELPLALALEWRYSKQEILSIYLNRAYLGGGAFGFSAASKFYFNKPVAELSHAEAALLAGLLRAPSRWSPLNDFRAAQDRARVVLDAMLEAGKIDVGQHAVAVAESEGLYPPLITETAPYFVDWVAEQVPESFWAKASDLVLKTTLDQGEQRVAENAIRLTFEEDVKKSERDAEAAMVILTHDGALRAMVGGRDYARSQFNRASMFRRHLGSAFKPVVYAAALERGFSPDSVIEDSPVKVGSWQPQNYTRSYRGRMSLRSALARSSNVAAVRLSQKVGIRRVVDMARRFGFSDRVPPYPSLALGTLETNPLEVASAYATFARDGAATPAYAITEIRDSSDRVLWSRRASPGVQAIGRRTARTMRSMLRSVVESGTGTAARLEGVVVVGKTGTTQDYRDAWFAGFTPDRVAVVWFGNDDFTPMRRVTGGSYPARAWARAMAKLHDTKPSSDVPKPLIGLDGQPEDPAEDLAAADNPAPGTLLQRLPPAPRRTSQRPNAPILRRGDGWGGASGGSSGAARQRGNRVREFRQSFNEPDLR